MDKTPPESMVGATFLKSKSISQALRPIDFQSNFPVMCVARLPTFFTQCKICVQSIKTLYLDCSEFVDGGGSDFERWDSSNEGGLGKFSSGESLCKRRWRTY